MRIKPSKDRPELTKLLEAAKTHVLSPRERYEQRISWVYGNLDNPEITKDMVREEFEKLYGPPPPE